MSINYDNEKIAFLKQKLTDYEERLRREMLGYRGVIHESAASEIKHSKVMVLRAMVENIKEELKNLEGS